jgi:hypothetical protein
MTDDDVEKIIKRNMNLQINLAGIRADFEEAQQRTWVGLTDGELPVIKHFGAIVSLEETRRVYQMIEAKLKEKNNA